MTKFPALDTRHSEGEPRTKPKPVGQAGSPAIHSDQGKARAASGGLACGMGKPAPIAGRYQFQSAESKAAATQRLRAVATNLSRLSFELRGGRFSHRAGLLSSSRQGRPTFFRGWIGTCDDVADSLRLRAAGLRDEQISAAMSPVLPADQRIRIEPCVPKPEADAVHSQVLSSVAVAMTNRDSKDLEACSSSQGIEYPQ